MKATSITFSTLLGYRSRSKPEDRGNCFGLKAVDGNDYSIVNFNLENLEALQRKGLKFPIEIKPLNEHIAVVHDQRIGARWYQKRYCEQCCPKEFLPITQLDEIEREIAIGRRIEGENSICLDFEIRPEFE